MQHSPVSTRVCYLDGARAKMLLLGIPFHISEIYRVSGGFSFLDSPDSCYVASLLRPGGMPLNPIVEMAIISFTVAGCLLVYELARRVPILARPPDGGPFRFSTGWKLAPKRIASQIQP